MKNYIKILLTVWLVALLAIIFTEIGLFIAKFFVATSAPYLIIITTACVFSWATTAIYICEKMDI